MSVQEAAARRAGRKRLLYLTLGTIALIVLVIFGSRLISGGGIQQGGNKLPIWALIPVAYIAGVLALLSPCSAAILPAFFAYSFNTRGRLVRMTYVFYLGLALVFVPISGASTFVRSFVQTNAELVFGIGGAVLIAFGIVALLGFDLGRLTAKLGFEPSTVGQGRIAEARNDETKVYLMGTVFGFATSSCTAPILFSVLAVIATAGLSALAGVLLMLVFALGIVTPLFVLAIVFDQRDVAQKLTRLEPVSLGVGRYRHAFHPVHLVSGTILILVGILFITTRGTLELAGYYTRWGAADAYEEINLWLQSFFSTGFGQAILAAVMGLLALGALLVWYRRRGRETPP